MTRRKLTDPEIADALASLPGWSREADTLLRDYRFATWLDGIAFVDAVAIAAEARDHHPDLEVGWRRVRVRFSTHDAGGITASDVSMAREVEALSAGRALPLDAGA